MKKLKQSLKPLQQSAKQQQLQPIQQKEKERSILKKYEEIFTQVVESQGNVCGVVFQQLSAPQQSIHTRYFAGNLIQDTVQWRSFNSVTQIIDFYSNPDHALVINSERLKLKEQNGRMLLFQNQFNTYIQAAVAAEYQKHCIFILFTNIIDLVALNQKANQVSDLMNNLNVNLDLAQEAEKQQNSKKKLVLSFNKSTSFTLSYKNSLKINEQINYTLKPVGDAERSQNQDFVIIFIDTPDKRSVIQKIAQFTQKVEQIFTAVYFLGKQDLKKYYFYKDLNIFTPTNQGPVLPEFGLAQIIKDQKQLVLRFNIQNELSQTYFYLDAAIKEMTEEYFKRPPYTPADRQMYHLDEDNVLIYNILIKPYKYPGKAKFVEEESFLDQAVETKQNQVIESIKTVIENVKEESSSEHVEKQPIQQSYNIVNEATSNTNQKTTDNEQNAELLENKEECAEEEQNEEEDISVKEPTAIQNQDQQEEKQSSAQTNELVFIPPSEQKENNGLQNKYPVKTQNQIHPEKIHVDRIDVMDKPLILVKLERDVPKKVFQQLSDLQQSKNIPVYVCMMRMQGIMIETILKKVPAALSLGFIVENQAELQHIHTGMYYFDSKGRQCGEWSKVEDFDESAHYSDIDDVD